MCSASEDQSIVVYNLLGANEDESVELILNPGNDCRRLFGLTPDVLAYEASDSSIGFYNLQTGSKLTEKRYEKKVV